MAAIEHRWVHLDLKMNVPPPHVLVEEIRRLAQFGATGVVIEWENLFPYRCVADAICDQAYTPQQVSMVLDECQRLGIMAIPLVQILGHLQWLLSQPAYAGLREFPQRDQQIRACDSRVWELLGLIIQELLDTHTDAEFMHLGADEASLLSRIDRPDCSAKREGPSGVFARHLAPLFDQLIKAGKRPIIYSDMVLKHPDALQKIHRDVVLMDWQYYRLNRFDSEVMVYPKLYASAPNLDALKGDDSRYLPYLLRSPLPGLLNTFASTDFLCDQGFDVIGGPAVQCNGDNMCAPGMWHADNIDRWVEIADERKLFGLCCTNWSLRGHLHEVSQGLLHHFLGMAADPVRVSAHNRGPILASNPPGVWPETMRPPAGAAPGQGGQLIWDDLVGDQWPNVLRCAQHLYAPPNWAQETRPLFCDANLRRFRSVSLVERIPQAMRDMADLSDHDPYVVQINSRNNWADALIAALSPFANVTEARAWQLACEELWLRNKLWQYSLQKAHGHLPYDIKIVLERFNDWASRATRFAAERLLAKDANLYQEDRINGLEQALDSVTHR